jgi:tetratricopeptide (TPR) repeat protein
VAATHGTRTLAHKRECVAVAATHGNRTLAHGTRTLAGLTAGQADVLLKLQHFTKMHDWRSVTKLERKGNAVADAVRITMPSNAAFVYCILGNAYYQAGRFDKAIEYHTQDLAIAKELGWRLEQARAYGNLGGVYEAQGDFGKAIECQTQDLEIAKELGNLKDEGKAYGNLGVTNQGLGDFGKAIEYHTQHLAIANQVGDQGGECRANLNLGICHIHICEYAKSVGYFNAQHTLAAKVDELSVDLDSEGWGNGYNTLKLAGLAGPGALGMGVALRLQIRSDLQRPAAGTSQAPGPHSHVDESGVEESDIKLVMDQTQVIRGEAIKALEANNNDLVDAILTLSGDSRDSSASACLEDRVYEAEQWLELALKYRQDFARLHLAYLAFDSGDEDAALAHLKAHLSWFVQEGHGECAGCGQTRSEDTPMLKCGHCRVAGFCNAYCQQMASKKAALGGNWFAGRHKDICELLRKWRQDLKDGVEPGSCTVDLLAFLQR